MSGPVTTIPPFANTKELPSCATFCGPLFDANGGCVPPAVPVGQASAYTACFCSHSTVAPFSTASTGICDEACQPDGLASIQNWFQGICGVEKKGNDNSGSGNSDSGGSGGTNDGDSSGASNGGVNKPVPIDNGGGDWISNHWQWVIMLVVLVVGIAGIWVGACIWRRRHLKKKDRQSTLPQKQSGSVSHPSWGPDMAPAAAAAVANNGSPGVFMPGTASPAPFEEKSKGKKKWTVSKRT